MSIELRPYQQDLIAGIREQFAKGKRSVCAVLGCGGGKSVIQGCIAQAATAKGNRVLFIVHRRELCQQITNTFDMCGVDFQLCQVGMVQTVCRRLPKTAAPALVLIDECHHSLSASYRHILEYFPKAIVVGFTATPQRMNEGGLGEVFQALVPSVSTSWLIEHHYLAPYKYYGVELADTRKLHTKNGDFDKAEVEALMNRSAIFGSAVDNWLKLANGQQTIVYCSSIETSKATAAAFQAKGINAMHLDGTTPTEARKAAIAAFRAGEVTVLCNVDLFGEGLDVPDCSCVVLLRPTKSLTLYIQQSMRSMRYKEGKLALILDHVGNFTRHGLPDDEREWSLESKKRREKNTLPVKQCPVCFAVVKSQLQECPFCKYVWEKKERESAEVVEGVTLEEIRRRPYAAHTEIKTWEELELFRKTHTTSRGKKLSFFWSLHTAVKQRIPIPSRYKYNVRIIGYHVSEAIWK